MLYKKLLVVLGIPLVIASLSTHTFASNEENEGNFICTQPRTVPPSPEIISILYAEYLDAKEKVNALTFKDYLQLTGYQQSLPQHSEETRDNSLTDSSGRHRIPIPQHRIEQGELHIKVLLIDFADKVGSIPRSHYENLLFSEKKFLSGSMRDYFKEVSLDKVEVKGSVHGWLRMPHLYSYYTNGESGMEWRSYPRNAPKMAEDAVNVALKEGITFGQDLDILNEGIVTALFLIHAGQGAERLHPSIRKNDIWSHKWNLRTPIKVSKDPAPQLYASTYLTVPHDCDVGVCSHELGHLAFQWGDFYDPNYNDDGELWDGAGMWDLMASGSYGGGGSRPVHPAALHKKQHNWVKTETINAAEIKGNKMSITLTPFTHQDYKIIKLTSPSYNPTQYLLLENRMRVKFDSSLPGEGLLVWMVDESREMTSPNNPGLQLVQADGQHHLEDGYDNNNGDGGDPFPGTRNNDTLLDTGNISTSFKNNLKTSGISLTKIIRNLTGEVSFDINYKKPEKRTISSLSSSIIEVKEAEKKIKKAKNK